MVAKKKETRTFEQQITRLEEIVAQMEKGAAELADSLALFDEPVELPFDTEDESDG